MKRRSTAARAADSRSRLTAAALLVIAAAAAWLPSFPGAGSRTTRAWRGYETLLVSPRGARPDVLSRLAASMGPGVVSEQTARVSFWDFTGMASARLADLDRRIDPRDPRHDRVMDDLVGYFRAPAGPGAAWTVMYLPARRAPVFDYLRISRILGPTGGAWRLLEFDPWEAFVALAGLLAFALLLGWSAAGARRSTSRWVILASAAMWIPFVLGGGLARLALSLLMLFTWYRAAESVISLRGWDMRMVREARGPLVALAASAGAGLLLLVPGGGFVGGALVAFAGPVVGSVLLLVALGLYWGRARRPRATRARKFDPVPIVRPAVSPAPGPAGVLLALAVLTAVAVIPLARAVPVPTPVAVLGVGDFSWRSLAILARPSRTPRLPDLGDLVAHDAFQQALAFGRPWGLPLPDERVYVREFLMGPGAGGMVAVQRRVKTFDSAWLDSCLRDAPPGSIERMLVAQGRAVAVGLRGSARELARELPIAVLVVALFFAWLARAPESVKGSRMRVPLMKGVLLRLNGAARRNQIP